MISAEQYVKELWSRPTNRGVTTTPPNTKTQNPKEPATQPDSASTPTKTAIPQITISEKDN